jgi:acyl-CoA dehydrogenase
VSAIAWELPEDVRAVRDGLLDFARKEILPRHEEHRDLFEEPRRLYREDGRFSAALKELIDVVRRVSAKAGY